MLVHFNKIFVVTGGSGLIGKSIIDKLNSLGATVVNAEINAETNLDFNVIQCDVTSEISVNKCIDLIVKKYGKIDGWVNNAYPRTADWGDKFEDIKLCSWTQNVDFQLNSVFICCQAVLRLMELQKFGSIVNIASIYGVVGPDFSVYDGTKLTMPAAYSAIKGGVINFTRYLASYFGPHGIRVNSVSPGGIFDHQDKLFVKNYEVRVPLRRMGAPSDISPAVSFLLSDDASYITGQNIVIDGGWTTI